MGVRHALFPALTLGAPPQRRCQLPDAILHGKRNCGLIAGPSSALRSRGFRVRPLSSLGLAFAAPACEPDKDTFVTCGSASLPFNAGSATAFGSALARCYGSDLLPLRLHLAHKPAVFLHRRRFGREGPLPRPVSFPARMLILSRLSASFIWRIG